MLAAIQSTHNCPAFSCALSPFLLLFAAVSPRPHPATYQGWRTIRRWRLAPRMSRRSHPKPAEEHLFELARVQRTSESRPPRFSAAVRADSVEKAIRKASSSSVPSYQPAALNYG